MTEREQQIETVAHKLAAVWPSSVRDDDSLIVSLSARIVDALQGDPANEMEFGGDPDAESPFVIPSQEGGAFPQGVGGARVDAAIAKRLASSPEQCIPVHVCFPPGPTYCLVCRKTEPSDCPMQWTIWVDAQGRAHEAHWGVGAPRHIEVVPLARALRAEEAARDFAKTLSMIHQEAGLIGWGEPEKPMAIKDHEAIPKIGGAAREALDRHPGFLPIPTGENE